MKAESTSTISRTASWEELLIDVPVSDIIIVSISLR